MTEQTFNRFAVKLARVVHFLDTRIPDWKDQAWCGAHADSFNPWRSVPGNRKRPPGEGVTAEGLPDCFMCVRSYQGRLERGEKTVITPKQSSMF